MKEWPKCNRVWVYERNRNVINFSLSLILILKLDVGFEMKIIIFRFLLFILSIYGKKLSQL